MRTQFTTENGSVYVVDPVKMTWQQTKKTENSGEHRSENGILVRMPLLRVGLSAYMQDYAVQPGCGGHMVVTSPLTKIEEIE